MISTMIDPQEQTATRSTDDRANKEGLEALFAPESVAVIGATDRLSAVGRTVLQNLLHPSFHGRVYPVNPRRSEVLGVKAYKSIREVPEPVDLAVLATPAHTIPGLIEECLEVKAKSAVVISAGFKERGPAGMALEKQIQEHLKSSPMRLIGPNCLGIMNPLIGMNATRRLQICQASW
jgi:acetyltransferase